MYVGFLEGVGTPGASGFHRENSPEYHPTETRHGKGYPPMVKIILPGEIEVYADTPAEATAKKRILVALASF